MNLVKTILKTDSIPRVDLDFMNHTHFEEVEMVEHFGKLVVAFQEGTAHSEKELAEITMALDGWVRHTQDHFKRENALMLDIGFPAYPIHSGEHEKVLVEMQEISDHWKETSDIDTLAEYVFSFWPEWFDAHVNSMDMMTAKFAIMQGYSADSSPPSIG